MAKKRTILDYYLKNIQYARKAMKYIPFQLLIFHKIIRTLLNKCSYGYNRSLFLLLSNVVPDYVRLRVGYFIYFKFTPVFF